MDKVKEIKRLLMFKSRRDAKSMVGSIWYIVPKILYRYRIENIDTKEFHIVTVSKDSVWIISISLLY